MIIHSLLSILARNHLTDFNSIELQGFKFEDKELLYKICALIGNWYFKKKEPLVGTGLHNLGTDKEKLKEGITILIAEIALKYNGLIDERNHKAISRQNGEFQE